MEVGEDLSAEALREVCGERPVRVFPALVSTGAEALAWARRGAPDGAVVVADYQAAPRGRAGREWESRPGEGLGFSLVLRGGHPVPDDGWLYAVGALGVAEVLGSDAAIEWPDEVWIEGRRVAMVDVHCEIGPSGSGWAVLNLLLEEAGPPRAGLLERTVAAIEARWKDGPDDVLKGYRHRCRTLGRDVEAMLLPPGPNAPRIAGRAVDVLPDGALAIETERGNRVGVRAGHLGALEDLP